MPRKPLHPTIYPSQTKANSIEAFASLIARSAIHVAQFQETQKPIEPDIEQNTVACKTSVYANQNVIQLSLELD